MKKLILGLLAAVAISGSAPPADAKVVAVYAAGHGGVQSGTNNDAGLGFMLGARLFLLDGYVDYTSFGQNTSVSRGILGLRGGFGTGAFRLSPAPWARPPARAAWPAWGLLWKAWSTPSSLSASASTARATPSPVGTTSWNVPRGAQTSSRPCG